MADAKMVRIGAPFAVAIPAVTNFTLDASNDAIEWVFQAEEAMTVSRIGLRQGSVTGTSPTFRAGFQGVDSSGLPDGTFKGGGSAYADVTPVAGGDGTWQWLNLGATFALARGEVFAGRIAYQSGTIDGSNNCSFGLAVSNWGGGSPKATQNNAGSRTVSSNVALAGYGSTTVAYGRILETVTTISVGTASTPDEVGWLISLPAGWGSTYKIAGVRLVMTIASGATYRATLYDADGTTVLQQVDIDGDIYRAAAGVFLELWFTDSVLAALNFGSTYRLTVVRQGGSTSAMNYVETDADADIASWPMGAHLSWTERTDAGAWTDRGNRRLIGELILADITAPSASTIVVPCAQSVLMYGRNGVASH